MKLSVIIVNFNHKYFPKLAVEALEKSECNFDYEIIVVDNASNDRISLDFLEQAEVDGRIKLIKSFKNVGFGQGNNLGVKEAKGEYIFFHNPDITVAPDSLQRMVDYLEKNPDIGILGPKLMYSSGHIQKSCRRDMNIWDAIVKRTLLQKVPLLKNRLEKYLMDDFKHDRIEPVELLVGAALVMPKKTYEDVGGFDKRYFLFMEDFDLCKMVRKAGYKVVYFPNTSLVHYHKRLSQGSLSGIIWKKVFWIHVGSALKYTWKWRGK